MSGLVPGEESVKLPPHHRVKFPEQHILRHYENELTAALLKNVPHSVLTLTKKAHGSGLISREIKRQLESLDPCVPNSLMCRYLLLHVQKDIVSQDKLMLWLELLSTVEVPSNLLSLVRQHYDSLVGMTNEGGDGERGIFKEFEVPALTEILAGHSSKWEVIAISLGLPDSKIKSIAAKNASNPVEVALNEVLLSWVRGEFEHAKPPTLENLHEALRSNAVGLGALANEVELVNSQMVKYSVCDISEEFRIADYTKHVDVSEGNNALLEVQISGNQEATYLWAHSKFGTHFDIHGIQSETHPNLDVIGTHSGSLLDLQKQSGDGILCILADDISSEGYYKCEVTCTEGDKTPLYTEPIPVTVHTPIDQYQSFLIDGYTRSPEIQSEWPPASTNSFINLALIKQEGIHKAGKYGHCTIRGDMDDIFKDKESITYDKALGSLSSGACLLIEGRPGSGKTTLVRKFSKDWARKEIAMKHVRLLFLIHLRGFCSDPNIGLRDLIGCYFSGSDVEVIEKYANMHQGLGLCFVLDGLDEYMPQRKKAYIYELIRKYVLPRSVVIVTSRPAAAADFRTGATRQIEILGFLRDQIYDYIEKYHFSKLHAGLINYLDEHPNVLHMCYLPIHTCMVCFLYDNLESDLPQTETSIYAEFTKFTMLRMLYRDESNYDMYIESLTDLPEPQNQLYNTICKLAFEMTSSSKQVMRQTEVKQFFNILPTDKDCMGLITIDKMAMMRGFQKFYTFLHLTFQEFLAAFYISSLNEESQMELIEQFRDAAQMKQVWKFYCGLGTNSTVIRFIIGQSCFGIPFKAQCSFESQQPFTCDGVVDKNNLMFKDHFFTFSDFAAIAYVISNTQHQCVMKVVFDKCTIGMEGIEILAKKACGKLSLITTLCYHGYDCVTEQLSVVNRLMHSLPCLEILDVSNTNLGPAGLNALTGSLSHPNLLIVKVGSQGNPLYSSPNLPLLLAKSFSSGCSKLVNVCFSGDNSLPESFPFPFYFYCNVPHVNMCFKLRPIELQVLFDDLMYNHNYINLYLTGCGIDDNTASILAEGLQQCTSLEILNLSCNRIGDKGAVSLAKSVKSCLKLVRLNLSLNRIDDIGAEAVAKAVASATNCLLYLCGNNITNTNAILQHVSDHNVDFHTLTFSGCGIGDSGVESLLHFIEESCVIDSKDLSTESVQYYSSVHILDISSNNISYHGAVVLSSCLKYLTHLEELNIHNNDIGSKVIESHFSAIKVVKGGASDDSEVKITFHGKPEMVTFTSAALMESLDHVGISLTVQQEAFVTNKLIKLQVHPCLTGPFVLPDNYEAASPAYFIQPINREPLPVTICLQHYVKLRNKRDCENMRFLLASPTPESSEGHSVYTFKEVNSTGTFRVEEQWAEITLQIFGLLILAKRDKGDHLYSVRLLQANTEGNEIEAVLYSCLNHPVYIKHCDAFMVAQNASLDNNLPREVTGMITADAISCRINQTGLKFDSGNQIKKRTITEWQSYTDPPKIIITLPKTPNLKAGSLTLYVDGLDRECSFQLYLSGKLTFHGEPKIVTIEPLATANLDVGISLSVQQQAFDAADRKLVKLHVHPCLTGPFVLPDNFEAVSPAYLIQSINREPPVPITIRLQHHIKLRSKRDCENMRFLLATPTPRISEGRSVYTFKEVNEIGTFGVDNQEAEITLEVLGLLILAKRFKGSHLYSVRLFQTNTEENKIEAVLCSCLSHPVYIEHCDTVIGSLDKNLPCSDEATAMITADAISCEVNEWDVKFESESQIQKKSIHIIERDYPPKIKIILQKNPNSKTDSPTLHVDGLDRECSFPLYSLVDMKNEQDIKALKTFEEEIAKYGEISRKIANGMFVGPPGSGKSSLMYYLLNGKPKEGVSASSGICEPTVFVGIDQSILCPATISENPEDTWKEEKYEESLLMQVIQKDPPPSAQASLVAKPSDSNNAVITSKSEAGTNVPPKFIVHSPKPQNVHMASQQQETYTASKLYTNPKEEPVSIRDKVIIAPSILKLYDTLKDKHIIIKDLQRTSSLYLRDTGGHIEFQEMMPLTIFGPSLFFFVFRADQDLQEKYTVHYTEDSGKSYNLYESSLTTQDALLQCLASVRAIGVPASKSIKMHSSFVFIIGTHIDKIEPSERSGKITKLNKEIDALILNNHFRDLVKYSGDKDIVIFPVDNQSISYVKAIRTKVSSLIRDRGDFNIRYPTTYLLVCLALQNEKNDIIPFDEFKVIAAKYGITEDKKVKDLLYFLHFGVGVVRYYNVPGLENLVVIQPQILFSIITNLVIQAYSPSLHHNDALLFKEKGFLTTSLYKHILKNKDFRKGNFLYSKIEDAFLKLLVYLRIIVPFSKFGDQSQEEKFFIPFVINNVCGPSVHDNLKSDIRLLVIKYEYCSDQRDVLNACPKFSVCPKGVFGVLITYLMKPDSIDTIDSDIEFYLEKIRRDQVFFLVCNSSGKQVAKISLQYYSSHLEVLFFPNDFYSLDIVRAVCRSVRKTVEKSISKSLETLRYSLKRVKPVVCIKCGFKDCSEVHPVSTNGDHTIFCNPKNKTSFLPENARYWYCDGECNCEEKSTSNSKSQDNAATHHPQESYPTHGMYLQGSVAGPTQHSILKEEISQAKLNFITWGARSGEKKKVLRLKQEMSVSWWTLGQNVGISNAKLQGIQQSHQSHQDPLIQCMDSVIQNWIGKGSLEYPANWEGLVKLLRNMEMNNLAEKILEAAKDTGSTLYDN